MKGVFVGTSGFSYPTWAGRFYPKDLPASHQLAFYAKHFNSVEINNSFYHLPKRKTYESWFDRTPDDFRFAIKGSRYITQFLALANTDDAVRKFFEPAEALKEKLEVVLWQLSPIFKADADRLNDFIDVLHRNKIAKKIRHAFEFRHTSWFEENIYKIMRDNNCGFVIAHSNRLPYAEVATSDFIYLRFHGAPKLFYSNYSAASLRQWVAKAKKLTRGKDVFAYFNNTAGTFSTKNAEMLRKFLNK